MSETLTEKLTKTREGLRLYQQERAILEVTELICQVMDEQDVSRSELARRIGKTKGYITQLLDGRTNMTVRTLSDAMWALNASLRVRSGPLSVHSACESEEPDVWKSLVRGWTEPASGAAAPDEAFALTHIWRGAIGEFEGTRFSDSVCEHGIIEPTRKTRTPKLKLAS